MKVLFVATKAPWPARDGGRLLVSETLRLLRARGHQVTLVAPVDPRQEDRGAAAAALAELCTPRLVPARERPLLRAAVAGVPRGLPVSVARHRKPEVARRVAALLDAEPFDVVHAEQLQAVANCEAAAATAKVPVVLRAQNVESQLWHGFGRGVLGPLARLEARRLRRFEARTVARMSLTLAITVEDARALASLSGDAGRVALVRAPFPAVLPPGETVLAGAPALVLLAGRGWPPNALGASWFEREVWPAVRGAVPGARLHRFGAEGPPSSDGVVVHASPAESRDAFAPGSILLVPLQVASGVRMKILEAWARGVPVVATPAAAAGLEARAGRELLIAASADDFARSVRRLAESGGELGAELVRRGRELLEHRHDPGEVAQRLEHCYEAAVRGEAPAPEADE